MTAAEPWKTEEWTDRDPDGFAPEEYNRAVATCRQRDELLDALRLLYTAQRHVLEVMSAGDDAYMAAYLTAEAVLEKWDGK